MTEIVKVALRTHKNKLLDDAKELMDNFRQTNGLISENAFRKFLSDMKTIEKLIDEVNIELQK